MAKFFTPTRLSENIAQTPEGFLLCLGVQIARTGWQLYGEGETPLEVNDEGTVNIYRSAEEVFRPETIGSFQGKSITIRHPNNFVAPDNWKELTKGTVQNVRRSKELDEDGEECLLADLLITEKMAIELVKAGLREVSCGYECEYEQTGEGEGKQYNIVGNHIALVEEGRAGPAYAINDHKGKVNMATSKMIERLKARFGAKVIDEAMAEEKKEDKKEESKDASAYDELVQICKDLGAKIDKFMGAKDEEKKPEPKKEEPAAKDESEEKKDEPAKDDAEGESSSMEDRLKAVEMAVSKLLEMKSQQGDEKEEGEEKAEDAEDDDFEESSLTGDTAERVEILAPGLKAVKGVDVQVTALEIAYKTAEGKKIIEKFTGGKKPVFDSAENISTLFIATSEVLKANRGNGLEKTKDSKGFDQSESKVEVMTADKMNEINKAHWDQKVNK